LVGSSFYTGCGICYRVALGRVKVSVSASRLTMVGFELTPLVAT
jgi:hypothetical protein